MDLKHVPQIIEQDEEAVDVPLYYRNGEPILAADGTTQATVGLIGAESVSYKKTRDQVNRLVARKQMSDDERRRTIAARAAKRWTGFEANGQAAEFSEAAALELLKLDFVLYQFEAGIRRDSDFFRPTSSD